MAKRSNWNPSRHGFNPPDAESIPFRPAGASMLGAQIRLSGQAPANGSQRLAGLAGGNPVVDLPRPQASPPPSPAAAAPPASPQMGAGAPQGPGRKIVVALSGTAPDGRRVLGEIEFPPGTQVDAGYQVREE